MGLSIWTSFIGGVLTFFSPCVLPLIPVYLGLITGLSFEELQKKKSFSDLSQTAIKLLLFILGFSVVFVLLGASGAAVGRFLIRYKFLLLKIAGLLMVAFGLYLFGVLKISFLERTARISVDIKKRGGLISSFVFGIIFGLAWSPCSGPILGAIVLLASTSANIAKGATYLFAYSTGIAVPLFISGLLFSYFMSFLSRYRRFFFYVDKVAGALLFFVGLLFLTGKQYLLFIFE